MLFSICDYIAEHKEIPGDVSHELGDLLTRSYDIRNIYISIPEDIPYMTLGGLTMKHTIVNDEQATIVMEE